MGEENGVFRVALPSALSSVLAVFSPSTPGSDEAAQEVFLSEMAVFAEVAVKYRHSPSFLTFQTMALYWE